MYISIYVYIIIHKLGTYCTICFHRGISMFSPGLAVHSPHPSGPRTFPRFLLGSWRPKRNDVEWWYQGNGNTGAFRWWFQRFFIFTPIPEEMIQFDEHIFQMGWFNHQPGGKYLLGSIFLDSRKRNLLMTI